MTKIQSLMTWRFVILGVSLFLIFVTAIFPHVHNSFLKWNILVHLNLTGEMTLAVWWASSVLFLSGFAAYQSSEWDLDSKYAWIGVALLFFSLSLDEIGSVHERVGNLAVGLTAYIIIALIAGSVLISSIWVLWKNKADKQGLILLLIGVALLASAAPNEYFEHRIDWPHYLTGLRGAFEEGLELIGAWLSLMGIARYQSTERQQALNPAAINQARKLLLAGFGFHAGIAWITVRYIEIGPRGDPAVWYFMMVCLVLALFFLLRGSRARESSYFAYLLGFFYFLALSVGSMAIISPTSHSKLLELGVKADSAMILAGQLFFISVLYFFLVKGFSRKALTLLFAIALVLGWGWYANDQFSTYIVSGFFSLAIAKLFLSAEIPDQDAKSQ